MESLVSLPAGVSHVGLTDEERARTGLRASTVRFAIGIEAAEDLVADLVQALAMA